MLKRDGYLNLCEAADFLGVPVGFLWSRFEQRLDPLFYLGRTREERDSGPWYEAKDLENYRYRVPDAVRNWRRQR